MHLRVKRSWGVFAALSFLGLLAATSAFADTYHFHFQKDAAKPEAKKPEMETPAAEVPAAAAAPAASVSASAPATSSASSVETTLSSSSLQVRSWRLGVGGQHFPGFWDGVRAQDQPGGFVSMAYVGSPYYAFNLNLGVHGGTGVLHPSAGIDFELYPFASAPPWDVAFLEGAFLVGAATDGREGAFTFGGRLNLNLNRRLGFTYAFRIGDSGTWNQMELGIITRI